MPARLSAFVIWALVAASTVFWGLRLTVRAAGAPAHAVAVVDTGMMRADLTRLFGAPAVAAAPESVVPAASSRFQLTGVMAPKSAGEQGVALIAVDGKMPRAYRVGAAVDGELVLQSVTLRSAAIGPVRGSPAVVLQMPPLPVAETGTLPPISAAVSPAARAVPPPVRTPRGTVAPPPSGAPPAMRAGQEPPAEPTVGATPPDFQYVLPTE